MGDVAEAPTRQFASVEARDDLLGQRLDALGGRDQGREHFRPLARVRAQNLEPIIVDAERKRALAFARRTPCDQACETEMNVAAGEGIEEEMPALARFQRLREKVCGRRQCGPFALHLDERARGRKLGLLVLALSGAHESVQHGVGERRRQRHPAALPARRRAAAACGADKGGLVAQADEFQRAAGEPELVARLHARDEALFDCAELRARGAGPYCTMTDASLTIAPMLSLWSQRDVPISRAPHAFRVGRDTAEAGIGREARTAASDEIEHPGPVLIREMLVGRGLAHFREQIIGPEAAAERNGYAMLGKHVQGRVEAAPALDLFL